MPIKPEENCTIFQRNDEIVMIDDGCFGFEVYYEDSTKETPGDGLGEVNFKEINQSEPIIGENSKG